MGIGSAMRSAVTAAINSIGSEVVITEYSEDTDDGGYSGEGEEVVSTQTETAIPYEEFSNLVKGKFGNLETGGTQIALKYNVSIDINTATGSKYKVTWQDEVYDVIKVNRYTIEDTLVAYIIMVSKRLNQ